MQIVIDIPDELYKGIEKQDGSLEIEYVCDELIKAVDNCAPLPKGHGRLLILDEEKVKEHFTKFSFSVQDWISEVGISEATLKVIKANTESE